MTNVDRIMKAAWYDRQGAPAGVRVIGEMATPVPEPGEVRVRRSDDFPAKAKAAAARGLNEIADGEWPGFESGERFPLESIAEAH